MLCKREDRVPWYVDQTNWQTQAKADRKFQLLCYLIVGAMLLLTIHALGELAVLYPENGAFFSYCVRFINPSWSVLRRIERKVRC
jgi:hypothetical protein